MKSKEIACLRCFVRWENKCFKPNVEQGLYIDLEALPFSKLRLTKDPKSIENSVYFEEPDEEDNDHISI